MSKTLVSVAFLALVGPAFAGSVTVNGMTPTLNGARVMKQIVVKYDDLDPTAAQGAATLYDRINHAATVMCTSNPGGNSALISDKVEKCRQVAVHQAVKSISSPELDRIAAN